MSTWWLILALTDLLLLTLSVPVWTRTSHYGTCQGLQSPEGLSACTSTTSTRSLRELPLPGGIRPAESTIRRTRHVRSPLWDLRVRWCCVLRSLIRFSNFVVADLSLTRSQAVCQTTSSEALEGQP